MPGAPGGTRARRGMEQSPRAHAGRPHARRARIPGRPIIGGGGGWIGSAVFLMKRDLTTGSGGLEYAAGSITSVLAYKMLKALAVSCLVE